MKIGILTFHSQLNYGGVLQCWALQTVLEQLGHEVVVVDREFEHQIRSYMGVFKGWGVKHWVKFVVGLLRRSPGYLRVLRYLRTVHFARSKLHLTPYSFKYWKNAPSNLGIDLIVVGSDQVWNAVWNDLDVYTLKNAPDVPAIGYAISLGMTSLPSDSIQMYAVAAKRFSSISVRETESILLLQSVGIKSTHVSDPTLLVSYPDVKRSTNGGLVCYFIDSGLLNQANIDLLDGFRHKSGVLVQMFTQKLPQSAINSKGIRMRYSAGPLEFLKAIATARYVVSDSFHALMFACVFGKPISLVHPGESQRKHMFSRICEFSGSYVKGKCIYKNLNEVLDSISASDTIEYDYPAIEIFKTSSLKWLEQSIESVQK